MESGVGRTAFVTGAGSGIGRASSLELGRRGYRLIVTDENAADAERTAGEVDGPVLARRLDVRDEIALEAVCEESIEWSGRIDVLVNNAGINSPQTVLETSTETWDDVFAVNVRGVFLCCRALLPHMIAHGGGVIVNVASAGSFIAMRERAAYCASKGAVLQLTRAMAIDHVSQGIRVNCVAPGSIDTPWVERLVAASDDPSRTRQEIIDRQPMGRLGTAEEIANAVAFLAGDEATFVTGSALIVDGGWTAQ